MKILIINLKYKIIFICNLFLMRSKAPSIHETSKSIPHLVFFY